MKRVSVITMLVLLLIIVFFTIFGKNIYECITPKVLVTEVNASTTINNISYLIIPRTALTEDGCVYLVSGEQGFSRMIYTVKKQMVRYEEYPKLDAASYYVTSGISQGITIISQVNRDFEDGDRVIAQ